MTSDSEDDEEPLEEVDVQNETDTDSDGKVEVDVQTDSNGGDDAPNEARLWIADHDQGRVRLFRFAQHQQLVQQGSKVSLHATAAEAREALQPEATQPVNEATRDAAEPQPPATVNQVMPPAVEALLAEIARELPAMDTLSAENDISPKLTIGRPS